MAPAVGLPNYDSTSLCAAGDCCAAAFHSGLCRLRVISSLYKPTPSASGMPHSPDFISTGSDGRVVPGADFMRGSI
jgi:hypothetical protein